MVYLRNISTRVSTRYVRALRVILQLLSGLQGRPIDTKGRLLKGKAAWFWEHQSVRAGKFTALVGLHSSQRSKPEITTTHAVRSTLLDNFFNSTPGDVLNAVVLHGCSAKIISHLGTCGTKRFVDLRSGLTVSLSEMVHYGGN